MKLRSAKTTHPDSIWKTWGAWRRRRCRNWHRNSSRRFLRDQRVPQSPRTGWAPPRPWTRGGPGWSWGIHPPQTAAAPGVTLPPKPGPATSETSCIDTGPWAPAHRQPPPATTTLHAARAVVILYRFRSRNISRKYDWNFCDNKFLTNWQMKIFGDAKINNGRSAGVATLLETSEG